MKELFEQRTETGADGDVNLDCFFSRGGVKEFEKKHEETYYAAQDIGPCSCLAHAVCVHSTRNARCTYMHTNHDTVHRLFGLGLYDMIPYADLDLKAPTRDIARHVGTFDLEFPHDKAMDLLLDDATYVEKSLIGFESDAAPDRFDPYEDDEHRGCPEYEHKARFNTALGDPIGGIILFAALFSKHIRPEHVSAPFYATGALQEGNLFESSNARDFLENCINHLPWNLIALAFLVTKAHLGAKDITPRQATRARNLFVLGLSMCPSLCTHVSIKSQDKSQAVVRTKKGRAEDAQALRQADQDIIRSNG